MASQLIVHDEFFSEALGMKRTVVVYLPSGYKRDTRRQYPVLYVHDGQNVFDGRTSYVPGQYWRLRESADHLLHERKIEPLIMVAVLAFVYRLLKKITEPMCGCSNTHRP